MCADKEYDSDSDEEQVVEEPVVEEPQEDTTLNNPDVVTKYQEAAKIAQAVMVEVMGKCITGAKVVDICKFGDELIEQKTAAIFRNKNKAGKNLIRGVAFPVCISVNEIVCHCSPLESDDSYLPLAVGDIVKIDLGVHIDGFMALLAHTIIVDLENAALPAEQIAARNAAINATWTALEVAVKLLKPGNTNAQVTGAIKQVAEAYEVRPIANSVMHQVKQFVIDGNKTILLREEPEQQKVESCTFETGDVFAIDIAMSTGDGKPRDIGARTTVYKRQVDRKYSLKNKSSRQFFNEVNKRYPTLPFSTRSFADEKAAKLGVRECVNHELLASYPVLNEKKGDFVAHAKATVLLLPSGNTAQITGLAPFTYIQAIQAQETKESGSVTTDVKELATKLSAPLSIGSTLARVLQAEKNVTLSETVMELLNQAPVESKKKAKKAKKAAAKAAEEGK